MAQDNERFKWRQDPATGLWTLPKAGDQTVKKHDLYAEYLKEYLRIVGEGAWKSKRVRVTVIDAFAGGGEYDAEDAGQSLVPGSPLRLLRAAEEAEQALLERDPSYDVEVRFWFNDAERDNADHLRQVLGREGYTIDGKRIRVTTGRFADHVDAMIAAVREQQPRAGKALVIADQTGWKDATPEMLGRFMDALPGVELLVTLSAGMLLNPGRGLNWNLLLSTRTWLHPQVIQQFRADMQQIRQEPDHQVAKSSRAVALRQVMSEMAVRTGATLFSAFTLVPERSNQYLWVVAHGPRARGPGAREDTGTRRDAGHGMESGRGDEALGRHAATLLGLQGATAQRQHRDARRLGARRSGTLGSTKTFRDGDGGGATLADAGGAHGRSPCPGPPACDRQQHGADPQRPVAGPDRGPERRRRGTTGGDGQTRGRGRSAGAGQRAPDPAPR